MLTRKQHELLMFIHSRIQNDGISPSFDEMKTALELRSKSGIHRLITALEERGFIRRMPHRARAIEIIRMPEDMVPQERGNFRPEVIQGDLGRSSNADAGIGAVRSEAGEQESQSVPLIGRIAAGLP